MSRYYRELHDRELLVQAALVLQEVQERKLLDIILPPDARTDLDDEVFPRRVSSFSTNNGRLALTVEGRFFKRTRSAGTGR
jgi:hypothetical protein